MKGVYEFPLKKFYWSTNEFKFAELPEINKEYASKADKIRTPFTGRPEELIQRAKEEEEEGQNTQEDNLDGDQIKDDDNDDFVIKVPQKNFTELDRLAFVVRAIDIDCAALPIGAVKLSPTHELRYNDTFKGLTIEEAAKIENYQHFRDPISEEKREYIARGDASFKYDFLDPVAKDSPNGSWAVHTDSSKTCVTVRSLLWPGFVNYHRANSSVFGFCYFGDGIKNSDLPFLLSGQ